MAVTQPLPDDVGSRQAEIGAFWPGKACSLRSGPQAGTRTTTVPARHPGSQPLGLPGRARRGRRVEHVDTVHQAATTVAHRPADGGDTTAT